MLAGCLDEIVSLTDLVDALGHLERYGAQINTAAAALEASGMWAVDGSLSMAAWLRDHARLSHRDAARLLREGRFLHRFDDVADAAVTGQLSASQIGALRAAVSKPTSELFGEHQSGVIDAITGLDPAGTEQACQARRANPEAVVDMPEPKTPERS